MQYGDAEPLPWWLPWLVRAERWHCPPWELFDGWTSKRFWIACSDALEAARAAVRQKHEREAATPVPKARK